MSIGKLLRLSYLHWLDSSGSDIFTSLPGSGGHATMGIHLPTREICNGRLLSNLSFFYAFLKPAFLMAFSFFFRKQIITLRVLWFCGIMELIFIS